MKTEDNYVAPEMPKPDNKVRAIFFMNLFCLSAAIVTTVFKILAMEDPPVSNLDFAVTRSATGLFFLSIMACVKQVKPWEKVPRKHYVKMFLRAAIGTWGFVLVNYVITLIPLVLYSTVV
jgi:hypothetical protein